MLDKFKQLAQLKKLQDEAKRQRFEGSSNGVVVVVTGALTVETVTLNPSLSVDDQTAAVKAAFNSAMMAAQRGMAQALQGLM